MTSATLSWFDTHSHLDTFNDAAAVLREAAAAGAREHLVPGVSARDWPRLLELCTRHPNVYAAPGLHPQAAGEWNDTTARQLQRLLEAPSRGCQREALRAQLRLAIAARKPVLVHCRKAFGELLEILIEERAEQVGGILHAYGGSVETARTAVDLGFGIAFGGSLTWPGSRRAGEVLAALPEDAVVIETDAPDLAPHPHRGEPNRPAWLPLIAAKVAEIRGWSLAETACITRRNARRILGLDD